MDTETLKGIVQDIVRKATELKDWHTDVKGAPVNYACVFSQDMDEYKELVGAAAGMGRALKETPTGLLFRIRPLKTVSGDLKLLKIRLPDRERPERGDADFTVPDYGAFKGKYLPRSGFRLIEREGFEMIELMDPKFDVRAYFSHPTLGEQLGIK